MCYLFHDRGWPTVMSHTHAETQCLASDVGVGLESIYENRLLDQYRILR